MASQRKPDPVPYLFLLVALGSLGFEIWALIRGLALLLTP
jgi:hypothetical protein